MLVGRGFLRERGARSLYCFSSKKDLKIVSFGRGRESERERTRENVDRPDSVVNDTS